MGKSTATPHSGKGGFGLRANSAEFENRFNSILKHSELGVVIKNGSEGTKVLALAELVTPVREVFSVAAFSFTITDTASGEITDEGVTAETSGDGMAAMKLESLKNGFGVNVVLVKTDKFLAFVGEQLVVENGTKKGLLEAAQGKSVRIGRRVISESIQEVLKATLGKESTSPGVVIVLARELGKN